MKISTALLAFLLLTGTVRAFGDEPIPVDLQLDFAVAQQSMQSIQPAWQKAQADYGQALAALQSFCKAHGDKIPGADPANSKRLACVEKPAPQEKK